MKSEKGTEKTKIKKILAAVLLLIVFVMVRQQTAGSLEHGSLQRKEPGEGSSQKSLEAIVDGESYDINVEIAERRFTKKEVKKELKKAKKEIDATFLGDNKSLNSVKKPVVMKDSYRNGNVEAEWRLDSYDVINTEGEFVKKELPKKGRTLSAPAAPACSVWQAPPALSPWRHRAHCIPIKMLCGETCNTPEGFISLRGGCPPLNYNRTMRF